MKHTPSRKALGVVAASAILVSGALAVTPAGAAVQEQAADNWGKIWKKKLQPKADQRYYTKTQADTKYATKVGSDAKYWAKTEAYSKLESDAKYYSRTESDGKYAAKQRTYRGIYMMSANGAGSLMSADVSFGVTLAAAPTAHYIPQGAVVPVGCSGSAAAPAADPGHLCVFEASASNANSQRVTNLAFSVNTATPAGGYLWGYATAAGIGYASGSWAMQPGGAAVVSTRSETPSFGAVGDRLK